MSGQAWTSVEEISDADRARVRREERGVRKFFFLAALVPLAASLFFGPLLLLAAVLALLGLLLGMQSPRLKRAPYKHGVRGVVEEAVTYRRHTPNSPTVTLIHHYRCLLYTSKSHCACPMPASKTCWTAATWCCVSVCRAMKAWSLVKSRRLKC